MTPTRDWFVVRTLAVEHGVTFREFMSPDGSYTRTSGCGHAPVLGTTFTGANRLLEKIQTLPAWRRFTSAYITQIPGDSHV